MIRFGEWLPDQPDVNNAGVTVATNVIPAANGYRSFPSFVEFSNAADHRIRGIVAAKAADDTVSLFCGDQGKNRDSILIIKWTYLVHNDMIFPSEFFTLTSSWFISIRAYFRCKISDIFISILQINKSQR